MLIKRSTMLMQRLRAHHFECLQQLAKLVSMLLLIIHAIKQNVLDKYFLLTKN